MEVALLSCWAMETKEATCYSNVSIILAESNSERLKRSTL